MKLIDFPGNTLNCCFYYQRNREGPNVFLSYYKGSATFHQDPLSAWRVLGVAKFTDMGKALKKWCIDTYEHYASEEKEDVGRADTSFANDTKMIT